MLVVHRLRTGGIGRYILTLARELMRRGHQCHVVVTEEPGDWFVLARTQGIAAHFIAGMERRSTIAHAREVADALLGLDPEVVILNHARHAQLGLALLSHRTMVFPFVHTDAPSAYDNALANPTQWDCVLAPSPRIAEGIARRSPGVRRECVPHGIELPARLDSPDPREQEPRFRLLYLGRLDRGKGLELLPAIVSSLRERGIDAELDVVGEGSEGEALRAAAGNLPIHHIGTRGPEETSRVLRTAHALLLPSESEGLPLTLLEAQAEGCVPVASLLPGSTDVAVEDGRSGLLVSRREVGAFVASLERLARDRRFWGDLSRAGRARVEESFSAERMGDRYDALFARVEAERRPPRRGRLDRRLFAFSDFLPAPARRMVRSFRERPAELPRRP